MKSVSPDTNNFLVQLLNNANPQVEKLHETPRAKELLGDRPFIPLKETVPTLWGDSSEDDEFDLAEESLTAQTSGRKRKQPIRYVDEFEVKKANISQSEDEEDDDDEEFMEDSRDESWDPDQNDDEEEENEEEEENGSDDDFGSRTPRDYAIEAATMKQLRRKALDADRALQEGLTQDDLLFFRMLALDPNHEYTLGDLEDEETLHRAFQLLNQTKVGQDTERLRLTPHINYDSLPKGVTATIRAKLELEDARIEESKKIIRDPRGQ